MINQVLDHRVEDMLLNPGFFKEILDFAEAILSQGEEAQVKIKLNPLVRSIGFLETLTYLR